MSAPDPCLEVSGLIVRRGDGSGTFVLDVEALDLRRGEVLTVIGPNGAGKSTLLRALAGLLPLSAGHVAAPVRGDVVMVFQRPIPFAGSVAFNVKAALRSRGLSRSEVEARTRSALAHLEIEHLQSRRAVTLSGGELRRMVLARAFALAHAVMLLDEPFDDLDTAGQESLSLDLRRVIDETRIGVAVVTHDLRRALLLADRIAVLLAGRFAQLGARDEVLTRPASPEIARQVGMWNVFAGVVSRASGSGDASAWVVLESGHRLPTRTSLPSGSLVWAGLRPEHLALGRRPREASEIGKALVRSIVSDGVACTVALDWEGLELRTYLLAGRGIARTVRAGDTLPLAVRPEIVHLMPR